MPEATQKLLLLVADGMGDWPLDALDGKTPMDAAYTPAMDSLAAQGVVGRCQTVPPAMPPGSDVANMALLGFDPDAYHTGRGPIEAAAQGLELDPEDLIFRLNLVTVSAYAPQGLMEDYAAGHIDTEEAAALLRAMLIELPSLQSGNVGPDGGRFEIYPGVQYRHLLVARQAAGSILERMAIRPPHDILDQAIGPDLAAYAASPRLYGMLREAAHFLATPTIAKQSRANALWPWGQGRPMNLPPFEEAFGLRGAVISAVDLVKGLGRAACMHVPDVAGATGLLDTNYAGKVQAAADFLHDGGEFVYVHIEAPDECGHMGDAHLKKEAMERFDALVVTPLVEMFGDEAAFLVTCDHYTPVAERTHTRDAVPFALSWPGCTSPSKVARFTEATANAAGLLVSPGHALLPWALEQLGNG